MQRLLVLPILLLVLVPGCGDDSDAGLDAATPFDAFVLDAPSIDAPATDAPAIDAQAIDAQAIDAQAIDAQAGGAGDPCESAEDCGTGFSCCYPCGIPGCDNVCEPTCDESEPACAGGCLLRP